MARPLPTLPHGPVRRRRRDPARRVVLACPRVSPEWELGALRVLMKPHDWTRGAIEHREPEQHWPAHAADTVDEVRRAVAERLGFAPDVHLPDAGDFYLVAHASEDRIEYLRATGAALSRRLPGLWLAVDRLFVRDGRFFRREKRFKFNLVEAKSVHLPRDVRAALRGML
jgi:hypothetical protein